MLEAMSDELWCVYSHATKTDGTVFYIGCGNANRPYVTQGRSRKWREMSKEMGRTVQIIATYKFKWQALEHEKRLLNEVRPCCNREGRKEGEILGPASDDWETIVLRLPEGGRKELDRKRANAGCRSVNEYCNAILFAGKVNHKKAK